MILDSGERKEFESGAVRDVQEGKGACYLLPLDEVDEYIKYSIDAKEIISYGRTPLSHLNRFIERPFDPYCIYDSLKLFCIFNSWDDYTMLLELSRHFEEGAKKYKPNNWKLGIPAHCYIDSAIRHYLKWSRGDSDESHARAYCWNLFCLLWTVRNRPEFNDIDECFVKQKGTAEHAEN